MSVSESIIKLVASTANREEHEIGLASHLANDLDLDSLDLTELAGDIEDFFDVSIDDESLMQCQTIGDIVAMVEKV